MGIRTGAEYRERLRDGRTVYANGERVKDVTTHPPFQRTIGTIAALYDLQHDPAHQPLLTYPSPKTGHPVGLSFLITESAEDITRRIRSEEFRAEATFGLMGRMPDFMNAMVTDGACYLGSFGSKRCVKPTTIPKAWSLPKTTESAPSGSGRSCFDFRKSFAFARSLVLKTSE